MVLFRSSTRRGFLVIGGLICVGRIQLTSKAASYSDCIASPVAGT